MLCKIAHLHVLVPKILEVKGQLCVHHEFVGASVSYRQISKKYSGSLGMVDFILFLVEEQSSANALAGVNCVSSFITIDEQLYITEYAFSLSYAFFIFFRLI